MSMRKWRVCSCQIEFVFEERGVELPALAEVERFLAEHQAEQQELTK
jgi:hypothetical protein